MDLKSPSSPFPTVMFRGCQSTPSNGYAMLCSVYVEHVEIFQQHQRALQWTMTALNWLTIVYTSISLWVRYSVVYSIRLLFTEVLR